jgi:hypothetical protein
MKHRLFAVILAAGIAAAAALPARAQSVHGWLDVVDPQSAVGWVCIPGDANTKVRIELWAWDTAAGGWTFIGETLADKQRIDVGRAGVCGTGLESNFHGFEWPVYPHHILLANRNFAVYAWHRPSGQFLNGGGRPLSLPLSSLPTSGWWRTDYDNPESRQPALLSCVWPFHGANSRRIDDPSAWDPFWIGGLPNDNKFGGAGATWPDGIPAPLGYSTTPLNNTLCINYDVNSNPAPWSSSNSAKSTPFWPTSNFWVVHANYEPAYSLLNSGPPGQSQPLNQGGVYALSGNGSSFTLGIDNRLKLAFDGIPFLSVGAQMGRGTAGPLAVFDPTNSEVTLQFTATKNAMDALGGYHMMAVFIEAIWERQKRWVWITLQQQTDVRVHWNWNAYNSAFYPGAEINMLSIDTLRSRCNIDIGPRMEDVPTGSPRTYTIPIGRVFGCADGVHGWSPARLWWQPLIITGVHLGMELPDGDRSRFLNVTYSVPQLLR